MTQPAHDATSPLSERDIERFRVGDILLSDEQTNTMAELALTAMRSAIETPTERQVQAGAVILATTPLIDAPKQLTHNEWMGLSRSILEAANAAR